MLDIGWSEMLIVGVVALIVVGPKDLPKMFHALGEFTGKARGMAREFQRAMESAAKEAGVDGIAKDIRKVTSGRAIKEAVGFDEIEKDFRSIGRDMTDVRKSPKAQAMPKAATAGDTGSATGGAKPAGAVSVEDMFDEIDADEAEVRDHDADRAARNAALSAVEEQRLIRARKIATARQQAAEIRARREAAEAAPEQTAEQTARQWQPGARQAATNPAPDAAPETGTPPTAARARPDADT